MDMFRRSIVLLWGLSLLSSCSLAWNPTPDPTQGLAEGTSLENTQEVNGAVTTNLALDKTEGLGLSLEETAVQAIPDTVEDRVAFLNPSIEITEPRWGDVVRAGDQATFSISGGSSYQPLFLWNGTRVQPGRSSFVLPALAQGDMSLLQAFLLNAEKEIVSFWTVALAHHEETPVSVAADTPVLTVLEPQPNMVYAGEIPILVHLSRSTIGPGGLGLAVRVNDDVHYVYHTQPFVLDVPAGTYSVEISVVDMQKQQVLTPLFHSSISVTVD